MLISGRKLLISCNNFQGFDKSSDLLKFVVVFIGKIIVTIVKNNRCLFVKSSYKHLWKSRVDRGSISDLGEKFINFFKNLG